MLRIPGKSTISGIPVHESKVPESDEIPILDRPVVRCILATAPLLKNVGCKWAIGGEAGEVILGVNVPADHLELLTTEEGSNEISARLAEHQTLTPRTLEKVLGRGTSVRDQSYEVRIRSTYAEFSVNAVRTEVYGSLQFKVGDWEWGDPLDFDPSYSYVVGEKVPVLPLRLKSELYLGLGWLDRVEKIAQAVSRAQHHHIGAGTGDAKR
jgi:hypothetical protein